MAFSIQEVTEIPARRGARGARDSKCQQIVLMAAATSKKQVALTSDSKDELLKIYKSMIQWINRHRDQRVNLRKDRETLYIWITPAGQEYSYGRKPRQPVA